MGCVASVPAFDDDGGAGAGGARSAVSTHPPHPRPRPPPSAPAAVRPVTEAELYSATAGFSPLRLLGEGGFGRVYQGVWADGTSVAVKVLDGGAGGAAAPSLQGPAEFWTEVAALGEAAGHPHIVPLLGVCSEAGGALASVLAHAAGGSLRCALRHHHEGGGGGGGGGGVPWGARLRAAAGAASGLAALHALGWAHGDVSSGNVLLNGAGEAWVSDLGLARRVEVVGGGGGGGGGGRTGGAPAATTTPASPRGAWAYLAPELTSGDGRDGRPTQAADVWALGVVFLELLTGQDAAGGGAPLASRLGPALQGGGLAPAHLDPRLFSPQTGDGPPAPQVAALIEAAVGCLHPDPPARPAAAAVAAYQGKAAAAPSDGGGRVRRAVEVPPPPPPGAAPEHLRVHPVASLMDMVTELDGGERPGGGGGGGGGNPFL